MQVVSQHGTTSKRTITIVTRHVFCPVETDAGSRPCIRDSMIQSPSCLIGAHSPQGFQGLGEVEINPWWPSVVPYNTCCHEYGKHQNDLYHSNWIRSGLTELPRYTTTELNTPLISVKSYGTSSSYKSFVFLFSIVKQIYSSWPCGLPCLTV